MDRWGKLLVLLLLTIICLLFSSICYGESKEIIAEGTYNMGDGETPTVAEERALLAAKRTAIEQAGTYVQSYSETKNYQLTVDEVKVIASGIMEVSVLDKHRVLDGNNINFWVKIKAIVMVDKIEDMAAKIKETSAGDDYKKLQNDYNQSQQEVAALKLQLQQTTSDGDRQQIREEIGKSELRFRINNLLAQGNRLMMDHQYAEAADVFTQAISENPRSGRAYLQRGFANSAMGDSHRAMQDFDQALGISSKLHLAHLGKGNVFEKMGQRYAAIGEYRMFIESATPDEEKYVDLARRRIHLLERGDNGDGRNSPYAGHRYRNYRW